jgi:nicotinate-nucleotide adenylyltransferase
MKLSYPLEFRSDMEVKLHDGSWCDVLSLQNISLDDQLNLLSRLGDLFAFMPDRGELLSNTKKEILKFPIKESVTFFGGSFFPFHMGHMTCLETCPEKNIVVVPDNNPQKIHLEKTSPYNLFLDLTNILKGKPFSVYPGFLGKNVPNPTADWITRVNIKEINFLMGDDSFMNLFKWTRPEEIINTLTKLYVVPRDFEHTDYEDQIKKVKNIAPNLQLIFLPDHPFRKLSSSSFRTLK